MLALRKKRKGGLRARYFYSSFSLTTSASCGVDTSNRIEFVLPMILWTVLGIRVMSSPSFSVTTLSFRTMST